MEVKVAFVAGLFCVVFSVFGSSQDIPDDVVSTEVKKTLVNGTTGILRCRFKGLPDEVIWERRSDTAQSPFVMTWSYGKKSGPRYEDGSWDIDENYSLVIRNVRNSDAGRYFCRVSNYKGILIHNYTDVTIMNSAVRTEQSVAVQKGEVGVLPCQVNMRPRRVSWVRGANDTLVSMDLSRSVGERSGSGYEEGLFNINSEYSLLISYVRILHEDSYFCEVTDFDTGLLFRNVTRLNVFAFPLELFPSIEECPREQQVLSSCTLRIGSESTLTCEVREYYPVTDLFFVHGSLRVDSLEMRVWNNSDGTRNKRITIATYGSSESVFECVARGPVGEAESRSMKIHLIRDVRQTRVAVATVIILAILVPGIIVIAVFIFKLRKRHMKGKYDRVRMVYNGKQRDLISYIELWKLVKYAREQNLSDKLGNVVDKLIKDECTSRALPTNEDYYQDFCRWKAGNTGKCQRKDLFNACRNAGLKSAIDELQKYTDSTRAVTADDLEHTLWHIAESDSIIGLLEDLGVLPEQLEVLKGKEKREFVEGAMNILKQWRDVNSSGNQEVMLSLALEAIKYTSSDEDFFRIPECQKRGLDKNEIHAMLLPQITSRHCTELIDDMTGIIKENNWDIKVFDLENRDVRIDNIIEQNRTSLFDSHQMIEDWWAEQNCSNYEKRYRLRRAANDDKERTDDMVSQDDRKESDEKWPSTRKLEQITKTGEIPSTALKAINFDGLLPRPKSRFIYKTELVDLSLDLIMEDLRPIATALGIRETKFTSYRQDFLAYHLALGTIRLVLQLFHITENGCLNEAIRGSFYSILDKAGYPNAMKRFKFAFEPSYGELFAIATAVVEDDKTKVDVDFTEMNEEENTVKEPKNSEVVEMEQIPSNDDKEQAGLQSDYHTTLRQDASLTSIDEGGTEQNDDSGDVSAQDITVIKKPIDDSEIEIESELAVGLREKDLGDLQRMLELTDKDIPGSYVASVLNLLKIWKARVCPGLIDHRVVLTGGLQKINKLHLVGRYQVKETSINFIEDMLDGLDGYRRTCLESLLKSRKYRRKRLQSSDMTSQWIYDWVADWTKEMESSIRNDLSDDVRVKETLERHRDFNDKLVDHGLLDLAREIMNIEHVL